MKFKLFIAVFIFLFAVLAIGFFTEKTADDDEHISGYDDLDDEEDAVEEGSEQEEITIPAETAPANEQKGVVDGDEMVDTNSVDSTEDEESVTDGDSDSIKSDTDEKTDAEQEATACLPDETRYIPCDHVQGKIQKQLCSASKVWEDENECFTKPSVGEMVSISSDSFWMGSPVGESGRNPDEARHFVQLSNGFSLGKYEVTQGLFQAILKYNPSKFKACGATCPVESISYNEALHYANEVSKIEGLSPCFACHGTKSSTLCTLKKEYTVPSECRGYRLPTEAEWELAARAGTTTSLYNKRNLNTGIEGSSIGALAWYMNNSSAEYDGAVDCSEWFDGAEHCGSQPHGAKVANDFDLYDMYGNVGEWTMDGYQQQYADGTESEPLVDPFVANGASKVVRGGSWASKAIGCRSSARLSVSMGASSDKTGFRLAKTE